MGFDEGRIVFDNDNGIYFAGQSVFGKLIFDQEKDKTFRGIYIKFKGFCTVHWRTSHTRRVNGKTETYYIDHNSHEEYVNQKIYLIGSDSGEQKIRPGHYEYPFQLMIPGNCPSSLEGTVGHIRYEVKAVVDRAFKMDQEKKAVVRVISPLDLNAEPGVKDPIQMKMNETYYCCCARSGRVEAVIKLPASGYCPGQVIPIEVSCANEGSVTIDSITFKLKKDTTFHAGATKTESEVLAELESGEVRAGSSRRFTAELTVPAIDSPNVRNCRYISIDYELKVILSPDGCHSNTSQSRKLVIGTIPLMESGYIPSPQDQMGQQNVAVVNQSFQSAYPGANPYPGQNSPYPAGKAQYPTGNSPYPTGNSPYPTGNSPYPGGNAPYPVGNAPYPSNTPYSGPVVTPYPATSPYSDGNNSSNPPYPPPYSEVTNTAPYPVGPNIAPYPTDSPSNPPYPVTNSPYPPPTSSPYQPPKATVTGLRTGTLGFMAQGSAMPQLPPGAGVPYPTSPSASPYAAASAPEPATPDEKKNPMP
ncbi:arrestin domain-containing protein 17-like [Epargyreus clarus]|uniref:arrestin domain-containing protein 17-like n=1 Tax=Epargyreus clarus TaxID=520877 RepID=UPI003C2B070C